MRRPPRNERAPAPRWLLALTLALSALLHLGLSVLVSTIFRAPALDLDLTLPMDIELGTAEALEALPPSPVAQAPSAASSGTSSPGEGLDGGLVDAGPSDAGASDAGTEDVGEREAGAPRARGRDAGAPVPSAVLDAGMQPARIPPGAQIAVRVDMARIRQSPIAGDVRALLAAIPDWKALLEGSGIDPLEQLDRLLIATPNLQRDKIVVAGRYVGGKQAVLDAVQRLGEARGVPILWRTEGNVEVAPWASDDVTPRMIALVGPRHFTISRAEDLPRVLAIAATRAQRKGARGRTAPHPADALLSMEEGEGLSLEVEGVAQFVRRTRSMVPERLRLAAIEQAGARVRLRGVFTYPNGAQASSARASWGELRDTYARNALVVLLGLSAPLADASIEQRERELDIELVLSAEQTRLILGYVRELLGPPGARP